VPVNERIQRLEDFRGKLQSPAKITEANRRLAALYEEEGQGYLAAGKFAMAENSFKNATALDPYDPALYTDLASLYEQQAQAESDKMQRATLWMQAGENWQTAANKEINSVRRKQFETQTALNYYNYANDVTSVGDASLRSEARQALYEARRNAPSGSDLAVKIDALLANIR
jgi:tetratricopeptide (TPR) repeat protein